jgi:hypothetical protein
MKQKERNEADVRQEDDAAAAIVVVISLHQSTGGRHL